MECFCYKRYSCDQTSRQILKTFKYSTHCHWTGNVNISLILSNCSANNLYSLKYPKGLGKTIESLSIDHAVLKIEKTQFSMVLPEVKDYLLNNKIETVVLFGVEVSFLIFIWSIIKFIIIVIYIKDTCLHSSNNNWYLITWHKCSYRCRWLLFKNSNR